MTTLSGHHEPDSEPPGYFRSAVPDLANLHAHLSLGRVDLESMRSSWSIASGITVAQRFRGGVQRTFSTHRALVGGCSITIFQSTRRQPYAGLLDGRPFAATRTSFFAWPLQYGGNECAPED